MEETFYIIKPEVIDFAEEIKSIIGNEFEITSSKRIALNLNDLRLLGKLDQGYVSNPKLFDTFKYFMRQDVVEVGVLRGNNVIKNFQDFAGAFPNPKNCMPHTLRYKYGKDNGYYNNQLFFLNGIHKSFNLIEAQNELDLFYTKFQNRTLLENCEELAKRVYDYPHENTHFSYQKNLNEIWNFHIIPIIETIRELNNSYDFSLEETLIAGYFHDVGRIIGNDENHHIISSDYLNNKLEKLGIDKTKILKTSKIILGHRGSIVTDRKIIESQILACADGMATINYFPLVFYSSYSKHNLGIIEGIDKAEQKLKKAWVKLMPEIQQNSRTKDLYDVIQENLRKFKN